MSELLKEIEELEQKELGLRQQFDQAITLESKENIVNEINLVVNELSEKRDILSRQQRVAEVEEKVDAENVPFSILGINVDGMPTPIIDLCVKVYRKARKYTLNEGSIELEQVEAEKDEIMAANKSIADAYEQLSDQHNELVASFDLNRKEFEQIIAEKNNQLRTKDEALFDAESKRDAAKNLVDEANAEIARLNQIITDYEQAEEYRQRQEQPIDLSADDKNELQAAADAVKKYFKSIEDYGSIMKVTKPDDTFELVKRSDLAEWEEADVPETDEVAEDKPTIEAPFQQFQDAHNTDGMAGDTVESESVPDNDGGGDREITEVWDNERITKFLKRHEKRLNRLENEVYRDGKTRSELAS